jgi:hypothetical protein
VLRLPGVPVSEALQSDVKKYLAANTVI